MGGYGQHRRQWVKGAQENQHTTAVYENIKLMTATHEELYKTCSKLIICFELQRDYFQTM